MDTKSVDDRWCDVFFGFTNCWSGCFCGSSPAFVIAQCRVDKLISFPCKVYVIVLCVCVCAKWFTQTYELGGFFILIFANSNRKTSIGLYCCSALPWHTLPDPCLTLNFPYAHLFTTCLDKLLHLIGLCTSFTLSVCIIPKILSYFLSLHPFTHPLCIRCVMLFSHEYHIMSYHVMSQIHIQCWYSQSTVSVGTTCLVHVLLNMSIFFLKTGLKLISTYCTRLYYWYYRTHKILCPFFRSPVCNCV